MNVRLMTHNDPCVAGQAAAICYSSDDPQSSLRGAMSSGHESVLEHATWTFFIEGISRVTLDQLTRHRLASYSVESQRYCGIRKSAIIPPSIYEKGLQEEYSAVLGHVMMFYERMRAMGIPAEDARYIAPQGTTTALVMTMNTRELRHFFSMRCCNRAQWEIQELANRMLNLVKAEAPALFRKAGPGCVKNGCPEGNRSCGKPREDLKE